MFPVHPVTGDPMTLAEFIALKTYCMVYWGSEEGELPDSEPTAVVFGEYENYLRGAAPGD